MYCHHGPGPSSGMTRPMRKPDGTNVTVMSPGATPPANSVIYYPTTAIGRTDANWRPRGAKRAADVPAVSRVLGYLLLRSGYPVHQCPLLRLMEMTTGCRLALAAAD